MSQKKISRHCSCAKSGARLVLRRLPRSAQLRFLSCAAGIIENDDNNGQLATRRQVFFSESIGKGLWALDGKGVSIIQRETG